MKCFCFYRRLTVLRERHLLEKNGSDLKIKWYDLIERHYSVIYHSHCHFPQFWCFVLLGVAYDLILNG